MKKIIFLLMIASAGYGISIRQTNIAQHALITGTVSYVGTNDRDSLATNEYKTNGGAYVFVSTNSPWTVSFDTTGLGDGTNILTFLVYSFTNTEESNTWSQTNIVDNSKTVINYTNFTNGQILSNVFYFRGTNFENSFSGISNIVVRVMDSNSVVHIRSNTVFSNGNFYWGYNLANLPSGIYTIWTTATNYVGIVNRITNSFTIASPVVVMITQSATVFTRGAPATRHFRDAQPQHAVSVSAIAISKTEITWQKWIDVVNWATNNGYTFNNPGKMGSSSYRSFGHTNTEPVTEVEWYDAVIWCNALSKMEGKIPVYFTNSARTLQYVGGRFDLQTNMVAWASNGYRLLTEAEWEAGARGGVLTTFPWGNHFNQFAAWFDGNATNKTHPVGLKLTNSIGLQDMCGNVAEWCFDWYGDYSSAGLLDPYGTSTGTYRVIRGGAFNFGAYDMAVYARQKSVPRTARYMIGFRVAYKP